MSVEHTFVNMFQLGNDVQADIREVVLKHLKEHRKKVGNSPSQSLATTVIRGS